ncbi:asparaginase [Candidatus Peregrinibacteria bacterium]|nr:MAG: asparaginase [Candidatus Peregrinibacteria bacterium]
MNPEITKPILHLATGGTIDSHWDAAKDTAVPNSVTFIPGYLAAVRCRRQIESRTLFMKDSREVNRSDREGISNAVAETPFNRLLMTSGTYLMPDFARMIMLHPAANSFDRLDRRVVFTGSLVPMQNFMLSDGGFNLGMSMAILEQGTLARVNVVMNGGCFEATQLQKDLTSATFDGPDQIPYDQFDLIVVGGSIDFAMDGLDGFAPEPESKIPSYLRSRVKMRHPFNAVNPFIKDSRMLSDEDKSLVLEMISRAQSHLILITMGIYKMRDMQAFLREKLGDGHGKTIMITGSRLPLALGDKTDAPFNLGYSLGKIGFVGPGVHISINGHHVQDDEDINRLVYTPEEIARIKQQSF